MDRKRVTKANVWKQLRKLDREVQHLGSLMEEVWNRPENVDRTVVKKVSFVAYRLLYLRFRCVDRLGDDDFKGEIMEFFRECAEARAAPDN
jgi:hypothetical protein